MNPPLAGRESRILQYGVAALWLSRTDVLTPSQRPRHGAPFFVRREPGPRRSELLIVKPVAVVGAAGALFVVAPHALPIEGVAVPALMAAKAAGLAPGWALCAALLAVERVHPLRVELVADVVEKRDLERLAYSEMTPASFSFTNFVYRKWINSGGE
jgi:hypothetical protein